jgi:uncharacterized protein (UPF0305 family)
MKKPVAVFSILFFLSSALLFSDVLVGKRLKVQFNRNDIFIQNVYTKYRVDFTIDRIIENIYDIRSPKYYMGPAELIGTADLYDEEFQRIIQRYLDTHANTDEEIWKREALNIARMIAEYIANQG